MSAYFLYQLVFNSTGCPLFHLITRKVFHTYFPKIPGSSKSVQKRRSGDKATGLDVFSKSEWNKLASEKKLSINYLIVMDV